MLVSMNRPLKKARLQTRRERADGLAAAHEPVGVYRNPWFMTYANAEKRWKHADE